MESGLCGLCFREHASLDGSLKIIKFGLFRYDPVSNDTYHDVHCIIDSPIYDVCIGLTMQSRFQMSTPSQRRLAARIGGLSLHLNNDSNEIAARARLGLDRKFEREVDPDGRLSLVELAKKLRLAKTLYYTRLALRSSKARQAQKKTSHQ